MLDYQITSTIEKLAVQSSDQLFEDLSQISIELISREQQNSAPIYDKYQFDQIHSLPVCRLRDQFLELVSEPQVDENGFVVSYQVYYRQCLTHLTYSLPFTLPNKA